MRTTLLPLLALLAVACTGTRTESRTDAPAADEAEPLRILLVATSHDQLGDTGHPTGIWMEELSSPYRIFTEGGADVDLASPKGGAVPVDPRSLEKPTESDEWFRTQPAATGRLAHSIAVDDAKGPYDLVYVVGGHGAVWDLPGDASLQSLLRTTWEQGGAIGAVCHGVAALADLRSADGAYLVEGKKLTSFSDADEKALGLESVVPFLLETRLRERGAVYEAADRFGARTVRDGRLVTGQNPASSPETARQALAAALEARDARTAAR